MHSAAGDDYINVHAKHATTAGVSIETNIKYTHKINGNPTAPQQQDNTSVLLYIISLSINNRL